MLFRQYQYGISRLRYRECAASLKPHHRPADKKHGIFYRNFSGFPHGFLYRTSQRQPYRNRMFHLSYDGHQFILHRTPQRHSPVYIVYRFYVEYRHAAFDRKPSRRNRFSGGLINQHNFIPCGINLIQQPQPDFRVFPGISQQRGDRSLIRFLNADHSFFRAYAFGKQVKCSYDLPGVLLQKLSMQL